MSKVFEVDTSRIDEFDFHNSDREMDIEVEIVVVALGTRSSNGFLDYLEFWDPATSTLIEEAEDPGALPTAAMAACVRSRARR